MTNINCSENCIYQKDGKCSLENVKLQKVNTNSTCAYFAKTDEQHSSSSFQISL